VPMATEPLVAVSYPVDEEFTRINNEALAGAARVEFTHPLGEAQRRETLARADALIGWVLDRELPPGALEAAAGLKRVQRLSGGAVAVDFAAFPPHLLLAGNVGAYAAPIAEHVLAMTLALAKRLPQRHAELAAGRFDESFSLTLKDSVCL